jgi:hypothetical protein
MADKRSKSRRLNFLHRVLAVQEAYQNAKRPGVSDAWIWREHIYPAFHISERSFREYLEVPASRELKQLQTNEC